MSSEREKIFPQTKAAIKRKIEYVQSKLDENTLGLSDMGADGDSMDDPYMWKLHTEREMLTGEMGRLQSYLGSDVHNGFAEGTYQIPAIGVGHEVSIQIAYQDGNIEEMHVTIGSTLDKQYLGQDTDLFNDENILISDQSPMALLLLGRQVGDKLAYQKEDGNAGINIVGVKKSQLLDSLH